MKHVLLHIVFLAILLAAGSLSAQVVREDVAELRGIDVDEQLGDTIPLGLTFIDERGQAVKLGDYFGQGKPVLLVLGYYECPMLCNLVFNGMTAALPNVDLAMGEQYQVVTVSIDPAETPELASAKKANYMKQLGAEVDPASWVFLTGDTTQIDSLAGALGFQYYYVEERDEYAHPAVVHIVAPDGVISRYLYGIQYNPRDLKLGLLEASEGKVGNTLDRVILYCYHYDPDAGGYVVLAQNVMLIGGVITVLLLGGFLVALWVRERYRASRESSSPDRHRVSVG